MDAFSRIKLHELSKNKCLQAKMNATRCPWWLVSGHLYLNSIESLMWIAQFTLKANEKN